MKVVNNILSQCSWVVVSISNFPQPREKLSTVDFHAPFIPLGSFLNIALFPPLSLGNRIMLLAAIPNLG